MERLRRLRKSPLLRDAVAETQIKIRGLIYPIFVQWGTGIKEEVSSMPGVYRYSVDRLPELLDAVLQAGIGGVMVFGIPQHKDETGSDCQSLDGIAPTAIGFIKDYCRQKGKELLVVADICLCEYTSHGHCGVLEHGDVENDASLPLHAKAALTAVQAGADMVAPSSMMDGVVAAIRRTLDEAGYTQTPIMGYSAKFASAFYGPFGMRRIPPPAGRPEVLPDGPSQRPGSLAGTAGRPGGGGGHLDGKTRSVLSGYCSKSQGADPSAVGGVQCQRGIFYGEGCR